MTNPSEPASNILVTGPAESGYTVVEINRPERKDALTRQTMIELADAIGDAGGNKDCHAIILTGSGGFCSGVDLDDLSKSPLNARSGAEAYETPQKMIKELIRSPVPTIAAVDGPAIGMGMDLALACDMRFVGPEGFFMQGWARVSLIPATGGALFLQRLAPGSLWQLVDEQRRVAADRLSELGLAEKALPSARVAAVERAARFASAPRSLLEGYVRLSRADVRNALDEHLHSAAETQFGLMSQLGEYRTRAAELKQGLGQRPGN
jgi:2-(1,2-epoxy-1,2-dihydrophenyl)acetyl-CoA isomerase